MKMFETNDSDMYAKIKVIGVGELGSKVINYAIENNLEGVEITVVDNDSENLLKSAAPQRLKISDINSEGSKSDINQLIRNGDMIYLVGDLKCKDLILMIAEQIKSLGEALTISLMYMPTPDEKFIGELKSLVDTCIISENDNLDFLFQAVRGITDLIAVPGLVGLDFADVKGVATCAGEGRVGYGEAVGENATIEATNKAIQSMNCKIRNSKGVLINILGSCNNFSMMEINNATNLIQESFHEDAKIIWSVTVDETLDDIIKVVIVATKFAEKD